MDLAYARKLDFDAGREFAAEHFISYAKLYHPYADNVVFDVEETAYSFANHVPVGTVEINIPDDRARDADFIEGVDAFCERFAKMVRREKAMAGKIRTVKVEF